VTVDELLSTISGELAERSSVVLLWVGVAAAACVGLLFVVLGIRSAVRFVIDTIDERAYRSASEGWSDIGLDTYDYARSVGISHADAVAQANYAERGPA
jgi:hypothetical protein